MNIKSHNTLKCVLFLGFIQIIYLATTKGGERKEQKKKKKEKKVEFVLMSLKWATKARFKITLKLTTKNWLKKYHPSFSWTWFHSTWFIRHSLQKWVVYKVVSMKLGVPVRCSWTLFRLDYKTAKGELTFRQAFQTETSSNWFSKKPLVRVCVPGFTSVWMLLVTLHTNTRPVLTFFL